MSDTVDEQVGWGNSRVGLPGGTEISGTVVAPVVPPGKRTGRPRLCPAISRSVTRPVGQGTLKVIAFDASTDTTQSRRDVSSLVLRAGVTPFFFSEVVGSRGERVVRPGLLCEVRPRQRVSVSGET